MRNALFSYRKANTPLHRLPATFKLFLQIALCTAVFAAPKSEAAAAAILIASSAAIIAAAIAARISLDELKRLRPILALGALYALFMVFAIEPRALPPDAGFRLIARTEESLVFFCVIVLRLSRVLGALLYVYRFFMAALSSLIFFETTSPLEVRAAFEQLQGALSRIFPPLKRINPALTIALAINFIPEIFSAWEKVSRAAKARRPQYRGGAFLVGGLYAQLAALLSCLIRYAETTRRAIANRCEEG